MKILLSLLSLSTMLWSSAQIIYPKTEKIDHKDTYFDTEVSDPYRWLEDDRSDKTAEWVKDQNKITYAYLDKIPYRGLIKEKMTALWNYEKISKPVHHGWFYYYYKNDGLQKQSVMYRRNYASWKEELFIDPNKFSEDGTVSLGGADFSKDGSMLALSISDGGSDWRTIWIYDVSYRKFIDTIRFAKFGTVSWKGNDTLFYSTYDREEKATDLSSKNQYHKLMRHIVGRPQFEDKLIFGGKENPYRYIAGYFTDNESLLIISAASNTKKNHLYLKNAEVDDLPAYHLTKGIESNSQIVDQQDGKLYIVTDYQAPNKQLMIADINKPDYKNWTPLIKESEFPSDFSMGGDFIWVTTKQDVKNKIIKYDRYGVLHGEIKLPAEGTVSGFECEKYDSLIYFTITNSISPSTIYKYDILSKKTELYDMPKVKFNAGDFITKQVFYTSKDGTKIPMTITHRKDLRLDGQNPTLLYGYGGFNVSLMPSFSTSVLFWIQMGGVYAVANLRGGGEYGNKWHEQGIKQKKLNVFHDFIAAAEFLKKENYTSSQRLAISGGSNGGLLVGATMTMQPELCKVALPAVGVLDMLRYHKFTAGAGWAYDYGTSEDSKDMFEYLKGYSPLHNLSRTCYPATMVTTGDHDDRVVPAHSFKFAATLQENQSCENPALIRIEVRAGHGAGKSTEQIIQETTDKYAFTLYNMGVKSIDDSLKLGY